MNLDLTEQQELLQSTARDFLQAQCPKSLVRELEESETGYSPTLWQKVADLGWLGLLIPEEYGGVGMGFVDLTALCEEIGYNLLPGPFFSTVAASFPILDAGSEEQKQEILPAVSEGRLKLSLALTEPSVTYDPAAIALRAEAEEDAYVLNGTKLFVENAHIADYLVVAARTGEGVSLFLVPATSPGVSITVIPTIGLDGQCAVVFDNVRVAASNILGPRGGGAEVIKETVEKAAVLLAAQMLGGMRASLEMTKAYVKERIAYERPIATNQVLQHYLANVWIKIETTRNIVYEAASLIEAGQPATLKVSAAKAWAGESFAFVTERCVQMHGAVGVTREHDIGLYYRRAKAWDLAHGDVDFHRDMVALELGF